MTVSFHTDMTNFDPFQCSVSCGVGIQQRDIYCQLKGLGQVNEAACNHAARPTSQRRCWLPACMQYHWLADEWEDVSKAFNLYEVTMSDVMSFPTFSALDMFLVAFMLQNNK